MTDYDSMFWAVTPSGSIGWPEETTWGWSPRYQVPTHVHGASIPERRGWICPVCNKALSPDMMSCAHRGTAHALVRTEEPPK